MLKLITSKRNTIILLLGLLSVLIPICGNKYVIHILTICWITAIASVGWNICYGYTGLLSFGHALFFGLSAYITLWLRVSPLQITPWIGIFIAASIVGAIGIAVAFLTIRAKGIYFALTTFALPQVMLIVFTTFWQITGGAYGVTVPFTEENPLFMYFYNPAVYYYIALGFLTLTLLLQMKLNRSKLGYCLKAIGSDEDAASSLGINPISTRLMGLGVSAFVTGLAGGIYINFMKFIDPYEAFGWVRNIQIILGAVLGGVGSIFGPVLGTFVVIPLSEFMKLTLERYCMGLNLLVSGLILMLFVASVPQGIYFYIKKILKKYL